MNKLDWIIDCLEGWKECNPEFWYDNDELALSYARELRDMEPVAWVERDGELIWHDINGAIGRNLYVLGESNE